MGNSNAPALQENLDVFTVNAGHEVLNIVPDFYNLEFMNAQRPEKREAAKLQAERWRETAARWRHRFKDTFFTVEGGHIGPIKLTFEGVKEGHPF